MSYNLKKKSAFHPANVAPTNYTIDITFRLESSILLETIFCFTNFA